jgi:hypothetical protein
MSCFLVHWEPELDGMGGWVAGGITIAATLVPFEMVASELDDNAVVNTHHL